MCVCLYIYINTYTLGLFGFRIHWLAVRVASAEIEETMETETSTVTLWDGKTVQGLESTKCKRLYFCLCLVIVGHELLLLIS